MNKHMKKSLTSPIINKLLIKDRQLFSAYYICKVFLIIILNVDEDAENKYIYIMLLVNWCH